MTKSEKLRELFEKRDIVRVIGAHDGLSAKLVERNGFDAVWASSFEISASYAVPDTDILTMQQYLERARVMNEAVSIPVIADCNTGYGGLNDVVRTVEKHEAAGIAAICIEDQRMPKVNSLRSGSGQKLAPITEFVGKIAAAKRTQVSRDFMVIARIEAFIAAKRCAEVIRRADAYVDAGADAVLIHSNAKRPVQIRQFCRSWSHRAPVVIIPTMYPMITEKDMKKMGVKMVIYANHGIRAAIKAMNETFAGIKKDKGVFRVEPGIASLGSVFDIQGATGITKRRTPHSAILRKNPTKRRSG